MPQNKDFSLKKNYAIIIFLNAKLRPNYRYKFRRKKEGNGSPNKNLTIREYQGEGIYIAFHRYM